MGWFGQEKRDPYQMSIGSDPDMLASGGGIGGGLPGMPGNGLNIEMPEDPYAGQRPDKPGFFGKVGNFLHDHKDQLSEMGAILMAGGDGPGQEAGLQALQQIGQGRLLTRRADIDRAAGDLDYSRHKAEQDSKLDVFGDGESGFSSIDGLGNIKSLIPGRGPKKTQAQQDYEYMQGLTPEQRRDFTPMTRGYGYSDSVFEQKRRLKAATPGKAPGQPRAAAHPPTGFILD